MNINPADLRIGQNVKVLAPVANGTTLMEGRIVSIDPNMVRVELKQNEIRSETYSVSPSRIIEVLA